MAAWFSEPSVSERAGLAGGGVEYPTAGEGG